jgi:hypothetical protein
MSNTFNSYLSPTVFPEISPKPTVVIVDNIKYTEATYICKLVEFSYPFLKIQVSMLSSVITASNTL